MSKPIDKETLRKGLRYWAGKDLNLVMTLIDLYCADAVREAYKIGYVKGQLANTEEDK